MKWQF